MRRHMRMLPMESLLLQRIIVGLDSDARAAIADLDRKLIKQPELIRLQPDVMTAQPALSQTKGG
jgi:hypothetical protein